MSFIGQQLRLVCVALQSETRIPAPRAARLPEPVESRRLNQAVRYAPLIGLLIGVIVALAFVLALRWLPQSIALLLAMAAGLLVTGAVNEQGFARVCDAGGGATGRAATLALLTQGHAGTIGSHGAIGILMLLLMRFATLAYMPAGAVVLALIGAHMLSRCCAVIPMLVLDDVEAAAAGAEGVRPGDFAVSALIGFLPVLLALSGSAHAPLLRAPLLIGAGLALGVAVLLAAWFRKRIGGYARACLGATQQVAELAFYLGVLGALT